MSDGGNILNLVGNKNQIPVDEVLDGQKGLLKRVIIIGVDQNDEHCFVTSHTDTYEIVFLLEKMKLTLIDNS